MLKRLCSYPPVLILVLFKMFDALKFMFMKYLYFILIDLPMDASTVIGTMLVFNFSWRVILSINAASASLSGFNPAMASSVRRSGLKSK